MFVTSPRRINIRINWVWKDFEIRNQPNQIFQSLLLIRVSINNILGCLFFLLHEIGHNTKMGKLSLRHSCKIHHGNSESSFVFSAFVSLFFFVSGVFMYFLKRAQHHLHEAHHHLTFFVPNPLPLRWSFEEDEKIMNFTSSLKKTEFFFSSIGGWKKKATIMFRFIEQHSHYVPSDTYSYLMLCRLSRANPKCCEKLWKQNPTPIFFCSA